MSQPCANRKATQSPASVVREGPWAPPVHIIKLTETQEITPYKWVDPDEER
jgi:hypothetical protein